ncbi:MAG: flavodoxin [Thermostichales cyanobacterium BF3_bins_165]
MDVINITDASPADFDRYAYIIIGCPMWNIGKLVTDRDVFFVNFDHMDLTGKKIAYFSPGDQVGYGDNFQDALGILAEKCAERGAINVGYRPTDGYDFCASKAVVNGYFVGLALDEDHQPQLTKGRIQQWVAQLKQEFGV